MGKLDGRVAVVTGAGSGLGLAIAQTLAGEGAAVVVAEYREEEGTAAARDMAQAGGRSLFVRTDVRRWEDMDRAVSQAVRHFGGLHIMVNNAGVLDGYLNCLEMPEELFESVVAINLKGAFLGSKRALAEMVPAGYGKIITMSSIAGLVGGAGGIAYTVTKHAVVGLTRQVACDFGPHGVRANAICPGPIPTNLRASSPLLLGEVAPDMDRGLGAASPEYLQHLIPLGTRGAAEDVAQAALFLASPESDYISGHTLVVDGGYVAK